MSERHDRAAAALRSRAGRLASSAAREGRPELEVQARARLAEASAIEATGRALDSGRPWDADRALAMRSEARVVGAVADWKRPDLDGDAGPAAPGRGRIEPARVVDRTWSERDGDWVPTITRVVRRGRSNELALLPPDLRATAERFEALAAAVGRMACVDPSASPARGRRSDGGAVSRCEDAQALAAAISAIGDVAVLKGRYASAHADRRRAITARDVVEAVCVRGWPLGRVLGRHGWSRRPAHVEAVRAGLVDALGRMMRVIG